MRVSTVCYATEQGLGVLAKDFYDNGVVTDPVVLLHASRDNRLDWYPTTTPVVNHRNKSFADDLDHHVLTPLKGKVDAVLFFETPFRWELIGKAKALGIPTLLMVMYECSPARFPLGCEPDVVLTPSDLDHDYYPTGVRCTVPVPKKLPARLRSQPVTTFVHNAGHGGLKGRNGTTELLQAWPHVTKDARLILRSQDPLPADLVRRVLACGNVTYDHGSLSWDKLYATGECVVFPEKFNGLSLPLQEAFASGMVVCTTDRRPNNTWLPREPLIPVRKYVRNRIATRFNEFDEAVVDPKDIADTINRLYGTDPSTLSMRGVVWGQSNGWDKWGPWYKDLIARLAKGVGK